MDDNPSYMFFGAAKTMEVPVSKHVSPVDAVAAKAPAVSIITPAYKVADLISATIESVFAQTFQDFEWIIVNDGSPDTEELDRVLAPIADKIVYLKQTNSGAAIARNTAIEHARGKYLAFLDGDDIWFPDYLESQLAFLEDQNHSMVYCDAELIGQSEGFGKTFMAQAPSDGDVSVASLLALRSNVITSGTVALKSVVDQVGRFEKERIQGEDFNLWVRIAHSGHSIGFRKCAKLQYRISASGFSGGAENRMVRAIDAFRRVEDQLTLSKEEHAILTEKIAEFEAALDVVRGKKFLLDGDFAEARQSFQRANSHRWRLKLMISIILIRVAPRLMSKLYLRSNPSEAVFVTSQ